MKREGAIKDALEEWASDEEQAPTTRHKAGSISEEIDSLEFAFMVLFWYDLLAESIKPCVVELITVYSRLSVTSGTEISSTSILKMRNTFLIWNNSEKETKNSFRRSHGR